LIEFDERYGIGDNLLIWLKSYLSNHTQRVVIKDALSNIGQLKAGVPQGSVLDPLLHNNLFPCKRLKICLKTIFSKSLLTQESNETGL
jgi:hypothetical protein